jgi:transposase
MNLEEFLEKLKTTKWRIIQGFIRADYVDCVTYCPITWVNKYQFGNKYETVRWGQAAHELGMNYTLAKEIVIAADNKPWAANKRFTIEMRQKLLEACGLKESE